MWLSVSNDRGVRATAGLDCHVDFRMYVLVWSPTGISGWDWVWIVLGVTLDIMKWGQIANNRKSIPGYSLT
jgi:hypothetical protein